MSKVIEADFFASQSRSWLILGSFMGRPSFNGARRIRVVDNDFATTRLIKILLEKKANYHVLAENDSAKAYQTARDFRPDLILLDIVMPEIEQHLLHAPKATSCRSKRPSPRRGVGDESIGVRDKSFACAVAEVGTGIVASGS